MKTDKKRQSLLLRVMQKYKPFFSRKTKRDPSSSFDQEAVDSAQALGKKIPQIQSSVSFESNRGNELGVAFRETQVVSGIASTEPNPQPWLVSTIRNRYQYAQLPSPTVIRILKLLPGKPDDPITFSLSVVDWAEKPIYEAISYAWGDPKDVLECFIDNKSFWITRSLYQALQNFRYENKPRSLWADAVCINQRDNAELGHQVNSHMQKIYKNATRTLVWLGIDDSHGKTKLAIETIKRVAPIIASHAGLADGDLNSLNDLYNPVYDLQIPVIVKIANTLTTVEWLALDYFYQKSWFSRLWVVRELNSSYNPISFVGPHSLDSNFVALLAIWIDCLPVGTLSKGGLLENRHISRAGRMRLSIFRHGQCPYQVLHFAREYNAADPRDRVYSMLTIPGFAAAWGPYGAADYTVSTVEVYRNIVDIVLRSEKNLLIFSYVDHKDGIITRPSWIPRWDRSSTCDPMWWGSSDHWKACGTRKLSLPQTLDTKVLPVRGVEISTIAICHKVPKSDLRLHKLKPSKHSSKRANLADVWRKFLASTAKYQNEEDILRAYSQALHLGLNEDNDPVTDEEAARNLMAFLVMSCGDKAPLSSELKDIGELQLSHTPPHKRSFLGWIYGWAAYRKFFVTKDGHIGLGPDCLREGDAVCVLFGGMVPFVLRPEGPHYLLVGECYCYGMMNGEVIEKLETREHGVKEREFLLY